MEQKKPRRPRRKSISVSSQSFYHLNELAKQGGYQHPGQVVDKLMRDMMIERRQTMRKE